jgi:hypothetical protein
LSRIKPHRRGGRPRDPHARRRHTTRRGRKGLPEIVDEGSPELVARKKIASNGSGAAVELVDYAAILLAHHLIDQEQHVMLATVATWLDRVRQTRDLSSTSVGGLWGAILSGQGGARKWTVPITSPDRRTGGDMAWFRVCQIRNGFAQLRQLELLDIVMRVAAGEVMPRNRADLVQLHRGIGLVAEVLRHSRRSPRPRLTAE